MKDYSRKNNSKH